MPVPSEIVDASALDRSGDAQIDARRRRGDLSVGHHPTEPTQHPAAATAACPALAAETNVPGMGGPRQTGTNVEDSIFADVLPDLTPARNEPVVTKGRGSVVTSPDLEIVWRGRQTETLFVAGINTTHCVPATIPDAFSRDFRCVALVDACGSMKRTDSQRFARMEIDATLGVLIPVEESRALVEGTRTAAVRL